MAPAVAAIAPTTAENERVGRRLLWSQSRPMYPPSTVRATR